MSKGHVKLNVGELHEIIGVLRHAQSDIWQTLRVSQVNLTGVDPCYPEDPPCLPETPKLIHQEGINESLRVHGLIGSTLQKLHQKDPKTLF